MGRLLLVGNGKFKVGLRGRSAGRHPRAVRRARYQGCKREPVSRNSTDSGRIDLALIEMRISHSGHSKCTVGIPTRTADVSRPTSEAAGTMRWMKLERID